MLTGSIVRDALSRLADRLHLEAGGLHLQAGGGGGSGGGRSGDGPDAGGDPPPPIDMLLAGGAGGLISGRLPASRTTLDCDVMVCAPIEAWPRLEAAAAAVAGELGLTERWLNNGAAAFREALLPGWADRQTEILVFPALRVFVPARVDFIATKAIAGRPQDLEDLESLAVTDDEWAFVREQFNAWTHDHWPESLLRCAIEVVDAFTGAPEQLRPGQQNKEHDS